jgi:tetratricopeptide (TPR) repeat protein
MPDYSEAERLGQEADALRERKRDAEALAAYQRAWAAVPEPRHDWDGAKWLLRGIAGLHLERGELDAGIAWLHEAERAFFGADDSGTLFKLGRAYLDRGDLATAKAYLRRAWDVSEGRAFRGEDPKYLRLLRDAS